MQPGPDLLLAMYAGMLRVRLFEERVRELFAGGRIPGFLHTSIGQEAIAVGVATALRADDYVLSTHRGHGHLVAKGGSLRGLMAELYGKANGICHGKGGTMHIADVSVGYLGANGVLAAGCVMAPGRASCASRSQFASLTACQMPLKFGLPSTFAGREPGPPGRVLAAD